MCLSACKKSEFNQESVMYRKLSQAVKGVNGSVESHEVECGDLRIIERIQLLGGSAGNITASHVEMERPKQTALRVGSL